MRRLLPTLLALLAVALLPSAASAATLPGQVIDGPSNLVQSFGALDVAADGTGALAYLKTDSAQDHVFVATLANGQWSTPQRVDTGLAQPSREVSVSAANGGRVVVTYVNGPAANPGTLESSIRPNGGAPFQRVTVVGDPGAQRDDVEMDPASGVAYVAWTDFSSHVRASRLTGTTWAAVGAAYPGAGGQLNNDNTKQAATDNMHNARVAVTPDGNAAITWGEPDAANNGAVYARRLNGTTVGPIDVGTVPSLNGKPAAQGEESDIDVDATGRAWVVFRDSFTYGMTNRARSLVRPFESNGTFGPVQVADDFTEAPTENAEFPRIDVNPAGQGLVAVNPQDPNTNKNRGLFSSLSGGSWSKGANFLTEASDGQTYPIAAIGDQGAGVLAWSQTKGMNPLTAHARQLVNGSLGGDLTLSRPELGTVNSFPLDASSDSKGNTAIGFSQGAAGSRAIVVAMVDGPPAGGGGGGGTDKTAPKLSSVKLSATRFRLGSLLPKMSAKKRKAIPTGTTISFNVDEDSTTTLTFKRVKSGRRVGKRCLPATRARRHKRKCTRLVTAGRKLTYTTKKGSHRIRFQGRFSRKSKLAPGTYEVTITSTDAAKNASKPVRKRFTLLPKLH